MYKLKILFFALLVSTVSLSVGCRRSNVAAATEESTEASAAAATETTPTVTPTVGDGSAAMPSTQQQAPAPVIVAQRPENLRALVPAHATAFALVDLHAAREMLAALVAGLSSGGMERANLTLATRLSAALEDPTLLARLQPAEARALGLVELEGGGLIVLGSAALVRDAPADGAQPVALGSGTNAAMVRDGVVIIGPRDQLIRFEQGPRLDAASEGRVWSALSSEAVLSVFVPRRDRVSPALARLLAPLARANPLAMGATIASDGSMQVTLKTGDREASSRLFGAAQVFVSQSLGELQRITMKELQGGIAYLNLVNRAAWSRVSLDSEGDTTLVSLAAPDCGGAFANLPLALVIGAALYGAGENPANLALPFSPMSAPVTRCDARAPTGPDLPLSLVRLASQGDRNAVLLFDTAAILRALLPSLGGLLPVRLDDQAVANALGDRFAGLRTIHDPEGSGAWAFDAAAPAASVLVLHSGAPAIAGPQAQLLTMSLTQREDVGAIYAAVGLDVSPRLDAVASDDRAAAVAAIPEDAYLALVVDAELAVSLANGVAASNVLVASIREAGVVIFAHTARGPMIVIPQVVADADAIRDDLSPFFVGLFTGISRRGGGEVDMDNSRALAMALDGLLIEITENVATIRYVDQARWNITRVAALLLGPTIGSMLPPSNLNSAGVRERLLENIAQQPHVRTPVDR